MHLLERYSGVRPFCDLYMIVAVSLLMISFIIKFVGTRCSISGAIWECFVVVRNNWVQIGLKQEKKMQINKACK